MFQPFRLGKVQRAAGAPRSVVTGNVVTRVGFYEIRTERRGRMWTVVATGREVRRASGRT